MNGEAEPTTISATATSPVVLPLTPVDKKAGGPWTLTLHPSHLALADAPGAQPYVILREQLMKSVILMESTRVLAIEQPRKLLFKLTAEGHQALADWIGLPFLAGFYLKRRYSWVSLWALLLVLGSLAMLISPPRGQTGQFNLLTLLLGLVVLTASGFARWRPHPVLFLVDAVFFACMAVRLALTVLLHGRSAGWLVLVVLMAWLAVNGVKHFLRFRATRIPPPNRKA